MDDPMDDPMVVDAGRAGFAQSQHHPRSNVAAYNQGPQTPQTRPGSDNGSKRGIGEAIEHLERLITSLAVPEGVREEIFQVIGELRAETTEPRPHLDDDDNAPVTRGELRKIVGEAIAQATQDPKAVQTKSWAQVASAPRGSDPAAWQPKVIVPARRNREVVIKSVDQSNDIQKRRPADIVQSVNTAIGHSEAIAARKLPSGDIVLTFKDEAKKHAENNGWVLNAFGSNAQLARRELAVIAKGIPAKKLRDTHDEAALLRNLLADKYNPREISKCKRSLPKNP
ncbi:hypothetical protein PG991_009191 [Apiospora marii]|uniref:Uncharacterized protein n=1 Tax=Apiospora marii TaxID=335849 RepID=A0ABR1RKG3_9PEZI